MGGGAPILKCLGGIFPCEKTFELLGLLFGGGGGPYPGTEDENCGEAPPCGCPMVFTFASADEALSAKARISRPP